MTTPEPDPRCPRHMDEPTPYPCGPCADARLEHAEWQRVRRIEDAHAAHAAATERAAERIRAINACAMCNEYGYIIRGDETTNVRCNHDPEAAERTARGMAKVRAALEGQAIEE